MLKKKNYVDVTIPDGCYLETRVVSKPNKKANEDVCEIPVPSIRGEINKTMEELEKIFKTPELKDIELKCDDDDDDGNSSYFCFVYI